MNLTNKKHILADVDVDNIIKKSVREGLGDRSPIVYEFRNTDTANRFTAALRAEYGGKNLKTDVTGNSVTVNPGVGVTSAMIDRVAEFHDGSAIKTGATNESYVAEPKQFKQVSEFISQKTKNSHVDLYKGYVESLNKVSAELDTADRTTVDSKHSQYRSLKLDETYSLNSVWLHELYFANCFDPQSEITMDSAAFIELQKTWGTFDDYQKDLMACATACGQGWAVTGYNLYLKQFVNTFISNHSQDVMLGLYPVLVIDMHEHAYYKDYLTDKKSYVVAMMREIHWDVVEERVNKAKALAMAVK